MVDDDGVDHAISFLMLSIIQNLFLSDQNFQISTIG